MDLKHFSHPHALTYHQTEQPLAETLICYGCDLQIQQGGPATFCYTCWQCQFFLHDQCFRAARSLSHPSHSAHPLSLIPYPTYPCGSFICNTCNQQGTGFSYSCSSCDFDLHIHCALINTNKYNNNFVPATQSASIPYPSVAPDYLFPPNHAERPYGDTAHWGTGSTHYPGVQYPFKPENMTNNNNIPNESSNNYPPIFHNQSYVETSTPYHNNCFPNLANNIIPNESPYSPSHPQNVLGNNFPNQNNNNIHPPSCQGQYPNTHYHSMPEPDNNVNYPLTVPINTTTSGHNIVEPRPQPQGVKHFSHEHLLNQVQVKEKNEKCSGCEKEMLGMVYKCGNSSGCTFSLHQECFGLPREIQLKFHKEHTLTLLTSPPYKEGFTCNGCLKTGKSFTYHCSICKYDLHVSCAFLHETVKRDDHTHSLSLIPSLPDYKEEDDEHVPSCDVCQGVVDVKNSWFYLCQECDFGTHVGCVDVKATSMEKTKEELLASTLIELQVLELKQRLSKLNADFTSESANSMSKSGI